MKRQLGQNQGPQEQRAQRHWGRNEQGLQQVQKSYSGWKAVDQEGSERSAELEHDRAVKSHQKLKQMSDVSLFRLKKYIFIYIYFGCSGSQLWHAGSFSCGMQTSWLRACELLVVECMRDLVPRPGIKPGPLALGVWSLTHWTTREVPLISILKILLSLPFW